MGKIVLTFFSTHMLSKDRDIESDLVLKPSGAKIIFSDLVKLDARYLTLE